MTIRVLTIVLGALLAVAPAFSSVSPYSNRGLWETDVTAFTTIDFESFNLNPVYGASGGILYDGVNYQSVSDCSAATTAGQACFINNGNFTFAVTTGESPAPTAHQHFKLSTANGYMQISLAPGTQAVGMDIYTVSLNNQPFNVDLYDSTATLVASYTNQNPAFFGFASTTPIATIRLSATLSNTEIYLDTLDFSGPPPVADTPESASFSYMGLGVLALWLTSGRKAPSMRRSKPVQS